MAYRGQVILPSEEVFMHIGYARVSTHDQNLELQQRFPEGDKTQ
jgi:predicted site-specific integrase-resolvase